MCRVVECNLAENMYLMDNVAMGPYSHKPLSYDSQMVQENKHQDHVWDCMMVSSQGWGLHYPSFTGGFVPVSHIILDGTPQSPKRTVTNVLLENSAPWVRYAWWTISCPFWVLLLRVQHQCKLDREELCLGKGVRVRSPFCNLHGPQGEMKAQ